MVTKIRMNNEFKEVLRSSTIVDVSSCDDLVDFDSIFYSNRETNGTTNLSRFITMNG